MDRITRQLWINGCEWEVEYHYSRAYPANQFDPGEPESYDILSLHRIDLGIDPSAEPEEEPSDEAIIEAIKESELEDEDYEDFE